MHDPDFFQNLFSSILMFTTVKLWFVHNLLYITKEREIISYHFEALKLLNSLYFVSKTIYNRQGKK